MITKDLIGKVVRIINDPAVKTVFFGKLTDFDDAYYELSPIGENSQGQVLAIQGIDPGIDNLTYVPRKNAVLSVVDPKYLMPFNEEHLQKILKGKV